MPRQPADRFLHNPEGVLKAHRRPVRLARRSSFLLPSSLSLHRRLAASPLPRLATPCLVSSRIASSPLAVASLSPRRLAVTNCRRKSYRPCERVLHIYAYICEAFVLSRKTMFRFKSSDVSIRICFRTKRPRSHTMFSKSDPYLKYIPWCQGSMCLISFSLDDD